MKYKKTLLRICALLKNEFANLLGNVLDDFEIHKKNIKKNHEKNEYENEMKYNKMK